MTTLAAEAHSDTPNLVEPSESLSLVQSFIDSGIAGCSILEGDLRDAPDGIYLSADQVDESGNLPKIESISLLPAGLELGAGDSHHGVLFGEILVEDGEAIRRVRTAIKPFDSDSEHAKHEFDNLLAVGRKGFDTFEPLALAKHGDTAFLITRRRPEINSLDNAAWDVSPSDTTRYEAEVIPNLSLMATYLARLHSSGIFHGDAQAKNFAITDTGGSLITDLEDATIATDAKTTLGLINGGVDPSDGLAFMDVTHCWYALIHPINKTPNLFLEGEPYDVCMEVFQRDFLKPYIQALQSTMHPSASTKVDYEKLAVSIYDKIVATT